MHKAWETKITAHAQLLTTPVASQCRELLEPCYKAALKVWDAFGDGKPHDPESIAEAIGMHINTVRHILRCFQAGGIEFVISPTLGWKPSKKMQRKKK